MAGDLTRRGLLRVAGVGAVSLAAARLGLPSTAHGQVACTPPRMAGWVSRGTIVQRAASNDPAEQVLFTTLMRVGGPDKLGAGALDDWYLWFWTHDAPICRLYVAPHPTAEFRPHNGSTGLVQLPAVRQYLSPPYPQELRFAPNHFSSGDVVWDPQDGCFYASPHSVRIGILRQAAFMLRSEDGIHWEHITGGLVHPTGNVTYEGLILHPNDGFDTNHVGYGRFLRDIHGNVVRHQNEVVHFYRGQNGTNPQTSVFKAGIATAPSMNSGFTRRNRAPGQAAFDPNGGKQFILGAPIVDCGNVYLVHGVADFREVTVGTSTTVYPTGTFYVKRPLKNAAGVDDPLRWGDGPGQAFYTSATLPDGPCLTIDDDGVQYLTTRFVTGFGTPQPRYGVELLSAPVG